MIVRWCIEDVSTGQTVKKPVGQLLGLCVILAILAYSASRSAYQFPGSFDKKYNQKFESGVFAVHEKLNLRYKRDETRRQKSS